MTSEEVRKQKIAIILVTALINQDDHGVSVAMSEIGSDLTQAVDGMYLLAISLASLVGAQTGTDVEGTLRSLEQTTAEVVPGIPVNWEVGIQIATAVSVGDPNVKTISAQVDIPTALQTATSIVVGLLWTLDGTGERDSFQWLQLVAQYLLEVGADQ